MEIDWSKAPEGAEYWCEMQWFKTIDGDWFVWCPGVSSWVKPAYIAPDNFSWWGNAVPRPSTTWNGAGLPPVGTVCEAVFTSNSGEYYKAKILAHDCDRVVFRWIEGPAAFGLNEYHDDRTRPYPIFRPIRTPEQIAAEEREKAIQAMHDIVGDIERIPTWDDALAALYDAGYRKTE